MIGHVLYFVRSSSGAIRIGWTSNLERRLAILSAENADPIYLVGVIEKKSHFEAKTACTKVHWQFISVHLHDEWFRLSDELHTFIVENVKSTMHDSTVDGVLDAPPQTLRGLLSSSQEAISRTDEEGQEPHLLNMKQLAERFSLSTTTMRRYVKRKQIPYLRAGHQLRFHLASVVSYVRQNCAELLERMHARQTS